MILSVTLALLFAGTVLLLLHKTHIPEIPAYLFSGWLLSTFTSTAVQRDWVSETFVQTSIMRELALLGLGILFFYSATSTVFGFKRVTVTSSLKTSFFVTALSLTAFTSASVMAGFTYYESIIFGVAAAVGSTLLDANLVKEEARKNHVYGWLTEEINLFDTILGLVILSGLFSTDTSTHVVTGVVLCGAVVAAVLFLRNIVSQKLLQVTDSEDELILLSGIATFIVLVWFTEQIGISALTGIYSAGLLLADTELGFRVRERFSSVKDFFTALSFFSLGYLLTIPPPQYVGMGVALLLFASVVKPLLSTLSLRIQGYDLRTGFLASVQSAQIPEVTLIAAILFFPAASNPVIETVTFAFTGSILLSKVLEDKENQIFERVFSSYELDSEKSSLPDHLENQVILAGFDWKTQGLEDHVQGRDVVVVDYDVTNIGVAERRGLPHLLADLNSSNTWDALDVEQASLIVSAVGDEQVLDKIDGLEVDAQKITIREDSEEVKEELRRLLREALE